MAELSAAAELLSVTGVLYDTGLYPAAELLYVIGLKYAEDLLPDAVLLTLFDLLFVDLLPAVYPFSAMT